MAKIPIVGVQDFEPLHPELATIYLFKIVSNQVYFVIHAYT